MLKHFFFETMTGTVLRYALIGLAIVLLALWLWAGGFARISAFVRGLDNPIDILAGLGGTYIITLPGQVPVPQGPDISGLVGSYEEQPDPEGDLRELEVRYETLSADARDLENFGESSRYRGAVRLSFGAARAPSASSEYLTILASSGNSGSVSLGGWSLMSLVSKQRYSLPLAASPYILGTLSSVAPPALLPGESAIIVSGRSPVGVSFRENTCSGYLSQLQSFTPPLNSSCPLPRDTVGLSAGTLQQYGAECIDYIASLPQCRIPQTIPFSLSASCRILIANTFTYNGCVDAHRASIGFNTDTWRLYLGFPVELWNNTHDVIRLLDAEGRTVDGLVY
jgi:hypothetical protein